MIRFFVVSGLLFFLTHASAAQDSALFEGPVLRLDPGMHTAAIIRADMDAAGAFVVTGSHDKTVRVWSGRTGRLLDTIPLPAGAGDVGKVYAVAISPDGALIAAGGWTRWSQNDRQQQIYVFDRKTREPVARIDGLPNVVLHLAFSPDGGRLVACLFGANGMRLYDRTEDWRELAKDADYGADSYGAAFASNGRFATTSYDGKLRLYGPEGRLLHSVQTGREQPFGVAFHPDGTRIAVGYDDSTAVDVFSASDLKRLHAADTAGVDNGNLFRVAWSRDGARLYAAGRYRFDGKHPVLAWAGAGKGAHGSLGGGAADTVMSLVPFPNGDLLVASQDPRLARIDAEGGGIWANAPVQADVRGQERELLLSRDGTRVGFGYEYGGAEAAWFDVSRLLLTREAAQDLTAPDQTSLPVTGWEDRFDPGFAGTALELERYERSRSLAIRPDRQGFVLGTSWSLRAYDVEGKQLWHRAVPGIVWAVNISGDGRYIVAAYGDGTIRWHRPEDGAELLAFFPFADRRNWVVWEPDGRFASTTGARGSLRWHVNRGWDQIPLSLPAHQVPNSARPEVIRHILTEGGTMQAVYAAEQIERKRALRRLTGATMLPGAQLHVFTVGVGAYGEGARHLSLKWADEDAVDLHAALAAQTDGWPYERGFSMVLRDDEATGETILGQLANIRERMRLSPHKDNLAVISFSGHGAVIGEGPGREFYLLPHDFRMTSEAAKRKSGISARELRTAIAEIAQHGRVLLLLDACRSGAISDGGVSHDARLLMTQMATRNVSVITSSSGDETSVERDNLRNGAFTEVVLEAFGRAGDANKDGMVSLAEFVGYVTAQVWALTGGDQKPTVEMRFEGNLFATLN